ncbi:MAG: efflux RND transporter periplasmic adaptor subunit, partial [Proteobacteria bacterium]|nr:efflux RND transporter periplasmic adaptor subunit [Pseudomonadota bacterium]
FLTGCSDKIEPGTTEEKPTATIKAKIAIAAVSNQPFIYEALGTIAAQDYTTLSGKIMGTVLAVNVKEGDLVEKGEVLVVLDQRQVAAGLRQSRATLEEAKKSLTAAMSERDAAQAGARLARTTFERYQNLYSQDSATRQEFEEMEARHLQAEAALARAEAMVLAAQSRIKQLQAAVSQAAVSKKDAKILAPYDGIVTEKMISTGDLATPGTPLITLEKTGGFQAQLVLPEQHIQAVRIGQAITVSIPDQKIIPELTGTVQTIVPSADEKSRSFLVKVTLPRTPLLRSGMFARVNIPVGETGILLIPESAVITQGQLTGYFMVDDTAVVRFRLVRCGRRFADQVEIISGLKPGTRYVISPEAQLKDGMKIIGIL